MKRILIIILTVIFFGSLNIDAEPLMGDTITATYKLHGQTRRFKFIYEKQKGGGLKLEWSIVRNLKLWRGSYEMSANAVKKGTAQSYLMPEDGKYVSLPDNETFGIISQSALNDLLKKREFSYNGVKYQKVGEAYSQIGRTIEVVDFKEGGRMTILDNPGLPLIISMEENPLEINWRFAFFQK